MASQKDIASLRSNETDVNNPINGGENHRQSPTNIRIKNLEGDFNLFPSDGVTCSAFVLNAFGEGTVPHLGLSTVFEEWCYNPSIPNDLGTRSVTFTAANGDELWGTHYFFEGISPISFEERYNFDGGTGRFENATGDFTQIVDINFDETGLAGTFILNGEGTLTY